MTQVKPSKRAKQAKIVSDDHLDRKGDLKSIGGSSSDKWNHTIAQQTIETLWTRYSSNEQKDRQLGGTIAALQGIDPGDEIEGMAAAQLIAAHNAAMECYRRAMLSEQTFEGRRENLSQANKLTRTWSVLVDALNKHRGKGQQKVTVEHVHVHSGGRAVVGNISAPGGGGLQKSKEQPHAQGGVESLAHAPESQMWSADPEGDAVPLACDGEWALPHARGKIEGRPARK